MAALRAITESPTPFIVVFDAVSYIGVLPDGTVIGFSNSGDLNSYADSTVA